MPPRHRAPLHMATDRRVPHGLRTGVRAALLTLAAVACRQPLATDDQPAFAPSAAMVAGGAGSASAAASAAAANSFTVCHRTGSGWFPLDIAPAAWNGHRGHGDYAVAWRVAPNAAVGSGYEFTRLTDAVKAADQTRRTNGERTSGNCRITISVAGGTYRGSWTSSSTTVEQYPLILTVPDITLQGASDAKLDASGRGTMDPQPTETVLERDAATATSRAFFLVSTDAKGYRGDGVTLQGFRFRAALPVGAPAPAAGAVDLVTAIATQRVDRLSVVSNRFEGAFTGLVDAHGASTIITRNAARDHLGCGLCLGGPASYVVTDNSFAAGEFTALFAAPVIIGATAFDVGTNPLQVSLPADDPQSTPGVSLLAVNNAITGYQKQSRGLGTAVRVVTFSMDRPDAQQPSTVSLLRNSFDRNTFDVTVDANIGATDAAPTGRAVSQVAMVGNVAGITCRAPLLVSFSRTSKALGVTPTTKYLSNSLYAITGAAASWVDHPPGFGNTLLLNGLPASTGSTVPTTLPSRSC